MTKNGSKKRVVSYDNIEDLETKADEWVKFKSR